MGVLLQAFYNSVPIPTGVDSSIRWWWDHLTSQAARLSTAGFSAVWLPPVLKAASGTLSMGYDPFDDYDIGSKDQKGTVPTRYGVREQLQHCVATMRANGLDVYLDMVEHHRSGDPGNFTFRYKGSDGNPAKGRFPKNPLNFVPNVPRDPDLGGPAKDDFSFGRELAPINGKPHDYVIDGLIDACDWLTTALDAQGYRLDDVKGLSTDFLFRFLESKSMRGKFAVGEFFDGNLGLLHNWIFNPKGMKGRSSAFDFPLRFALAAMCNNPGRFDMSQLDHAGLAGTAPLQAVTFVENHDTDHSSPVVINKVLGYAYILTAEGYPCVFYRDYSRDRGSFGLQPQIDNLIWIHETLAAGETVQRWKDFNLFVYERLGAPKLLVALNNDPSNARSVTVNTSIGQDTRLHDYSGHGADLTTDQHGSATITIPRNHNGSGYVCYSRENVGGSFTTRSHSVTQHFAGAEDLDILPALEGEAVHACRVWCAHGTPIRAELTPDLTNWTDATEITVELRDPEGKLVVNKTYKKATPAGTAITVAAADTGFYAFVLSGTNLPQPAGKSAYVLRVTYTASRDN
jgi:alpha-amylase